MNLVFKVTLLSFIFLSSPWARDVAPKQELSGEFPRLSRGRYPPPSRAPIPTEQTAAWMGNQPPKTEVEEKLSKRFGGPDTLSIHCNNQVWVNPEYPPEWGLSANRPPLKRERKLLNDVDPGNKDVALPIDKEEEGSVEINLAEIERQLTHMTGSQYTDTYSIGEIYSSGLKMFMPEELGGKRSQLDFQGNILEAKSTYMDATIAASLREPFQFRPKPWEPSDEKRKKLNDLLQQLK
ncbi:MAG: hypothetical protein K2X98_01150 [Alphaproteobacteria bacterium]|nr:hypothetical protein [Alphaproteobacteria bacterium]